MPSLNDIRARLAAQEEKSKGNFKSDDNSVYAHWNIEDDMTSTIRFLEDGNVENPYFWVERNVFKFPFNGVKPSAEYGQEGHTKEVTVQVPCIEMFGEKDPVLDEVRTFFKDPALEELGRKYWKKRTYLFQGFVRDDPMAGKEGFEAPENPIRRFLISPQIFKLIKDSLMDPEIEELPTHRDQGLDFRIKKGNKAGYADYTSSSWARKETALTEEELAAIEEHGLNNLADFLPKRPTEEGMAVIKEMFEASVDGEAYDCDRWGKYYTPFGIQRPANDADDKKAAKTESKTKKTIEKKIEDKVEADDSIPFDGGTTIEDDVKTAEESIAAASKVEDDAPAASSAAEDILKKIRARQ